MKKVVKACEYVHCNNVFTTTSKRKKYCCRNCSVYAAVANKRINDKEKKKKKYEDLKNELMFVNLCLADYTAVNDKLMIDVTRKEVNTLIDKLITLRRTYV